MICEMDIISSTNKEMRGAQKIAVRTFKGRDLVGDHGLGVRVKSQ
jgi:hypothetical protein